MALEQERFKTYLGKSLPYTPIITMPNSIPLLHFLIVKCMQRHSGTTKPFIQLNQKSWPKSCTRTIPVPFWELVHIFKHCFWNYRSNANILVFGFFFIFLFCFKEHWTKWTKSTQVYVQFFFFITNSNFWKYAPGANTAATKVGHFWHF